MRAMVMSGVGGPEVLLPEDMNKPQIKEDHDVLVRVMAAGVNPVDTKLRGRGIYGEGKYPAILGCDGSGIVEAVGSAVTDLNPGDEVYYCYGGIGITPGNYAEYNVVPDAVVAKKPESLGFAEAAAAPLVLITAWESLFDRANLKTGQHALIHAGAGGVGHVAIQLAVIAGAEVATTVSTDEKAELVQRLGAARAIRYREENVPEAVRAWTGGKGVEVALDTVGEKPFTDTIPAMATYGDLVTILQVPDQTDWKTARLKNLRISQELMLTPMLLGLEDALAHQGEILRQCAGYIDAGRLAIHLAEQLPLEEADQAHRLLERGGMTGKITLEIQ